jgi:hypothetical protein
MRSVINWFRVSKHRKYVYRVSTGGLVIAAGYGLVTAEEVAMWGTFLATALVTGMADANTTPEGSDV